MKDTNKTTWASIKITASGSAIVCLKSAEPSVCLYFENTHQLSEAISKKQIRVKHWIISVPDSLCIKRSIELPAGNTHQAHKMLEFELSSYLPLPIEELVYGCLAISKKNNLLKTLVYILKLKALETILAKFKSIGIKPSKVMVDSVAVQSWFSQHRSSDRTQIDLLFGNKLFFAAADKNGIFQRHDEIPLQDDNLDTQKERLTTEIQHFIAETAAEEEQPVLKIVAKTDIQPEIKNWLNDDYNTEFLKPPQLNSFAKESSPKKFYIAESVTAQGLVTAVEDPEFAFMNLLPGNVLKKAMQKKLITNTAVTAALSVLVILCLWLNFAAMNWRIQRTCKKISKEIAPIKHIAAGVESKRQKVKAIQAQLANRKQIGEIFMDLYKYSPKQISISQMKYSTKTDSATLNIKGQAKTLSNAFEYSDAMKDSELLNNIQIINAQQIPRPGGSIVEFKAQCTMRGS